MVFAGQTFAEWVNWAGQQEILSVNGFIIILILVLLFGRSWK